MNRLIRVRNRGCGFFSNWNQVLGELVDADIEQNDVSVDWVEPITNGWVYGLPGQNVWNELFLPVATWHGPPWTGEDVRSHDAQFPWHRTGGQNRDTIRSWGTPEATDTLRALHRSYVASVILQPGLLSHLWRVWSPLSGCRRVVGIHHRHPWHYYDTKSDSLTWEDIERIIKWEGLEPEKGDRVFLASDLQHTIDWAKKTWPDLIVAQDDVDRAPPNVPEYHSSNPPAEKRGPRLAYQVYADVWCLSRCSRFYGKVSNVTLGVQIMTPTIDFQLAERGWLPSGGLKPCGALPRSKEGGP
jgi:hypothetical protein